MARNQWIALETKEALQKEELRGLLRESYDIVFSKLPKKIQQAVLQPPRPRTKRKPKHSSTRKRSPSPRS
jgi:hypothetical protein